MSPTTHPWPDTDPNQTVDADGSTSVPAAFGGTGHPGDDRLAPRKRQEPSRPGWPGVIAVGVGAAVLAGLTTAGTVNAFGSPANASTSSTTQQSAPLVTGGGSTVNWVATAAAVKPSVVSVRVQASDGSGGEGSGVILDTSGRVLTNNHVIAAAAGA